MPKRGIKFGLSTTEFLKRTFVQKFFSCSAERENAKSTTRSGKKCKTRRQEFVKRAKTNTYKIFLIQKGFSCPLGPICINGERVFRTT